MRGRGVSLWSASCDHMSELKVRRGVYKLVNAVTVTVASNNAELQRVWATVLC